MKFPSKISLNDQFLKKNFKARFNYELWIFKLKWIHLLYCWCGNKLIQIECIHHQHHHHNLHNQIINVFVVWTKKTNRCSQVLMVKWISWFLSSSVQYFNAIVMHVKSNNTNNEIDTNDTGGFNLNEEEEYESIIIVKPHHHQTK